MQTLLFYGDLNCPFCYAQSERIHRLGFEHLIEWRGIEHLPDLRREKVQTSLRETEMVREEVERLWAREPDLDLVNPEIRPSSYLGTLAIIDARSQSPDLARRLRRALYRALWVQGRDISDPTVVNSLASDVGVELSASPAELLHTWTREWRDGPFDERLPAIAAGDDSTFLGLGTEEAFRDFVWMRRDAKETDTTCKA